jgi:uncharacterized protein (TIGR02646 family)
VRGIKKSAPPWLAKHRKDLLAGLAALGKDATEQARSEHARVSHFDALGDKKRDVRKLLWAEQRGLCVYCEVGLPRQRVEGNLVPEGFPIEHWRPLSKFPALSLDWANLYLSCTGQEPLPQAQAYYGPDPHERTTCDPLKLARRLRWDDSKDSTEEDLPWPVDMAYEHCVGFRQDGRAFVKDGAPLNATQRRALQLAIEDQDDDTGETRASILNLNSKTLVAARKAAITSEGKRLSEDFPNQTASAAERAQRAAAMLDTTEYPSFVSARVAYLTRSGRKKG